MLNSTQGKYPPQMPLEVSLPVNTTAKKIHLLSGIGGWSFPASREKSTSMIVRLNYVDGTTENHELKNGIHFADYIRHVDLPESEHAFNLNGQQTRYLTITPKSDSVIDSVSLLKGPDATAPIVVAITLETQ